MHTRRTAAYAILLLFILTTTLLRATDYYGQAGAFLRYSPSARALAMGRAYTAIGQDANAIHWNPGALAQLRQTGLSVVGTQASLFGLSKYSSLSVGVPFEIIESPVFQSMKNVTLGLSVLNLTSDITEADDYGNLLQNSTLNSSQGAMGFALAIDNNNRYLKNFSLGLGVDYIWNNVFGAQKNGVGMNAGIYYRNKQVDVLNWFAFALAVRNMNKPDIALDPAYEEIIPLTGRFGVAFLPPFCSSLPAALRPLVVSIDYDLFALDGNSRGLHVGMEYNVSQIQSYIPLRLRVGTNTKESAFTFGVSLDLPSNPFVKKGLQYLPALDYSFNFYSDGEYLGDVKQGAISFAWTPKTPEDWYKLGMTYFPDNLFLLSHGQQKIQTGRQTLQRVFDNPQLLNNPNYAQYGYSALLRLGDLEVAQKWLDNNRDGLLKSAMESYERAEQCISIEPTSLEDEHNERSLLYRLQNQIKTQNLTTERLFNQPYVTMIKDKEHVQFLKGYSHYLNGNTDAAVKEWKTLDLPIAKYFHAVAEKDAEALKSLAFSAQTGVSPKILFPFFPDFDVADNALFQYAQLKNSKEWMIAVLNYYPNSDIHDKVFNFIRKGSL